MTVQNSKSVQVALRLPHDIKDWADKKRGKRCLSTYIKDVLRSLCDADMAWAKRKRNASWKRPA